MNRYVFLLLLPSFLVGCSTTAAMRMYQDAGRETEVLSQAEIRSIQTRVYHGPSLEGGMRASIHALQDLGFIVDTADIQLGLIKASLEISPYEKADTVWHNWWFEKADLKYYQSSKVRHYELNITVRSIDESVVQIRASILAKLKEDSMVVGYTHKVYDRELYVEVFNKIDKSLFLDSNKI